jgi:hypothetical protein
MARTKLTAEERVANRRLRVHGVKKQLAVMWTRSDHIKARLKKEQFDANAKKPAIHV